MQRKHILDEEADHLNQAELVDVRRNVLYALIKLNDDAQQELMRPGKCDWWDAAQDSLGRTAVPHDNVYGHPVERHNRSLTVYSTVNHKNKLVYKGNVSSLGPNLFEGHRVYLQPPVMNVNEASYAGIYHNF